MRRNVVWNCNGVMVKGNNHTIEHNTIFDTDPLNFESDGQPRDLALYSWSDFGTWVKARALAHPGTGSPPPLSSTPFSPISTS